MSEKFTAKVTTIIQHNGVVELHDKMVFGEVDQEFVDYLFGSCRMVLNKLIRLDTVTSDDSWTLHYQTTISDSGGKIISNPKMIHFPPMSREQGFGFLNLAIAELAEANKLRYSDFSKDTPVLKKEWWLWKLVKLIFSSR